MKKALAFLIFVMIVVSSCGYRMGTHSTKTNLTAWKAEKQAKKEAKKEKSEKPNTPIVHQERK
jgi:hypothetical protein